MFKTGVEGLWVIARLEEGSLIKGYISKQGSNGEHKIKIVEAEIKELIGKEKLAKYGDIKRSSDVICPQEAKALIDVALTIRDREWFDELLEIASNKEPVGIDRWNRKLSWEMN